VNEPPIFSNFGIEPVTRIDRPRDVCGIAQAQYNFRRKFELFEDLIPNRHQTYRARILEAEIAITHSLFEKSNDLASDLSDVRVRPPCHRQGEIVKAPEIVTVEEAENPVVKLDDLPALPMAPRIVRCHRRVPRTRNLIRHIDPERAQNMRAQRGAAAMHAQHENDRPALYRTRDWCDPVAPRRFGGERL